MLHGRRGTANGSRAPRLASSGGTRRTGTSSGALAPTRAERISPAGTGKKNFKKVDVKLCRDEF